MIFGFDAVANTASDRTLPTSVALQNANGTVRPRIASSIVEGSGGSGDWNGYALGSITTASSRR